MGKNIRNELRGFDVVVLAQLQPHTVVNGVREEVKMRNDLLNNRFVIEIEGNLTFYFPRK